MNIYMNYKTAIPILLLTSSFLMSFAHADDNLIPVTTSESSGYESFNAYVLKNSIKRPDKNTSIFSVMLTGVSTIDTKQLDKPVPVSSEDRIEEYDLNDGRVILTVNMNCKKKTSKVQKILSLDPDTGKLKEQANDSDEQDKEMNKALHPIVCK